MRKKIKIFVILILIGIFSIGIFKTFGQETSEITICSSQEDFERYKCQVKNFCKKQEYGKNTTKIVSLKDNYEKDTSINKAQEFYSSKQNKIYGCGVLEAQRKVFEELIERLVKTSDKTGILKSQVIPKIKQKLQKIKSIKSKNKCLAVEKKQIKKIVLDQSTLELCKYNYFMHYLYNKNENSFDESILGGKKEISIIDAKKFLDEQKNKINYNLENSIKIYNTAYKTYTQYDDFLKTHIMMDLLKEDYKAFRDSLYQMLHPINQTIYKVINAQNP